MVGWTRGKAVHLSYLNGSLICAVILSCSIDTTSRMQKLELLISRKSVSQLQNWLPKLIIFIAVLNTFFLTKPLSSLNLWSQKNVSRSQPHLMRWVWGCWPAKRPLRQNRLSESRWEICMRALASSCQNTCSCERAWHGCRSFSAPFWGAQVILWAETQVALIRCLETQEDFVFISLCISDMHSNAISICWLIIAFFSLVIRLQKRNCSLVALYISKPGVRVDSRWWGRRSRVVVILKF